MMMCDGPTVYYNVLSNTNSTHKKSIKHTDENDPFAKMLMEMKTTVKVTHT